MSDGTEKIDTEKLLALMEIMKMAEDMNSQSEGHIVSEELTNQRWRRLNDFDDKIQTEFLRAIKVAIPYMDLHYQKNLSIIIKLIEIQRLLKYYDAQIKSMEGQPAQTQNLQQNNREAEMLRAMRGELSGAARQKIDAIIKMMETNEIITKMKEMHDDRF